MTKALTSLDASNPDISGTARLLEQNRILNEEIKKHGEKRALFAFALTLSENSNIDYQPDDAYKVKNAIDTMMQHDLKLPATTESLKAIQDNLNRILSSQEEDASISPKKGCTQIMTA